MTVLNLGSININAVHRAPRLPRPVETLAASPSTPRRCASGSST